MPHLLFFVMLAAAAAVFALLEIEIEGPHGWAARLPTWRLQNRWTRLLMGSRELTGYHLYVHLFVIIVLHLPYALADVAITWAQEARIIAFLVLFWILEDFLWFVFNRDFGLSRFTPAHATWHSGAWWWIMPREYWIFLPIGLGLYGWSYM